MFIENVNVSELAEKHPELQKIQEITARHGEKSDISELCEVIAHLFAKIDGLTESKNTVTLKREK